MTFVPLKHALNKFIKGAEIDLSSKLPELPKFDPKKVSVGIIIGASNGTCTIEIDGIAQFSNSEIREIIENAFKKEKPE